jgi:hypothetical protein
VEGIISRLLSEFEIINGIIIQIDLAFSIALSGARISMTDGVLHLFKLYAPKCRQ